MSIRWKLIVTFFALVFLPVYALNRYAIRAFDRFTRNAQEQAMAREAAILGESYRALAAQAGATEAIRHLLGRVADRIPGRLRLLGPDGALLADTAPDEPADLDADSAPELASALAGRYGARWYLTPDRRYVYYEIAVPVLNDDGSVLAVVHARRHTGQITLAIFRMIRDQRLALALALAVSLLVAVTLSLTLTRRLRRLTRAAAAYARGEPAPQVPVEGRDEIGELGRAVAQMTAEIEARNRYNREFVSTVVHELKTPLTAIRGAAEVLEDGAAADPAQRGRFLANIRFEVERILRMAGELAQVTRLETETAREPREPLNYPAVVREILDRLLPTLDEPHPAISVQAPEQPLRVRVNPARLEQVFANLLENALRYTPPEGRIEIRVEEGPGRSVTTTVRDNGRGIAPENLSRVFDRFFTTEPQDQIRDYGSGIGLSIVRSIVASHGGTIRAASAPGSGAAFIFTLPLAAEPLPGATRSATERSARRTSRFGSRSRARSR